MCPPGPFGRRTVDTEDVNVVERFVQSCLCAVSDSDHDGELTFAEGMLFVRGRTVMRWDDGIMLVDRRIRGDHPLYLHVQFMLRSHGHRVIRVSDPEHPEEMANLRSAVDDVRSVLRRATSMVMDLNHNIATAVEMMETLRVYCNRYGYDFNQHPSWFTPKELAMLALKDRLFQYECDRYPVPPPVMGAKEYRDWASVRLEQSTVSGLVRRVAEHYISSNRLIFLRDNPPMIKVFYRRKGSFAPLFTLTAWLGDLANRYGSENAPELYTGLLEVLSSPFVPAGRGSVTAVLKRYEYRGEEGRMYRVPYLDLECPCCSAQHEYRPANRMSVHDLMNVPIRACCFYAPDILLPVANYTRSEIEETILECALVNM